LQVIAWLRRLFSRAPKPLPFRAAFTDRVIVRGMLAVSGVPRPDERVVDRIAVAARTVIKTVDEQAERMHVTEDSTAVTPGQRAAMDVELDGAQASLNAALVFAGARPSGAAVVGFEIMRRLRETDG
jgi:hypothetical protein